MKKNNDLTHGRIFVKLLALAFPIIGASFVEMAYNMIDMIWIGRLSGSAVAAVGSAGFFMWFGFSFVLISKIGAEIGIAQAIGKKNKKEMRLFAENSLQLNIFLSVLFTAFLYIFAFQLISFFNLGDKYIIDQGVNYLKIISLGMPFLFINPVISGIFNGSGDSKTPFIVNSIGLGINMILDPILIFGLGIFPKLEVKGAAIATVISHIIVSLIYLILYSRRKFPIKEINLNKKPNFANLKRILNLGFPIGLRNGLFCIFSILIAKIISRWGPIPIAVQKVGAQIEALSWRTTAGFSTAISTFVGQNYGAKNWERIWKGFFYGLALMTVFGLLTSYLFIAHAEIIFSFFIPEKEAMAIGVIYLQIIGISQLFMIYEIYTAGAFNGLGKTLFPAIVSIVFTGLRVPASMYFSQDHLFGLNSVWWSICLSSVFKGLILFFTLLILMHKHPEVENIKYFKSMVRKWDLKFFRDKRSLTGR